MIDTIEIAEKLQREGGLDEKAARAIAQMHGREERYISSTALDLLRATMDVRFAKIDTQFAEVDTKLSDLKLWIIVTLISVVGLGLSIAGLLFYRGH